MEHMRYVTGLEPIAKQFDYAAERAEHLADGSQTQRDANLHMREAQTWRQAAEILRSTSLTKEAPA